MRLRHAGDEVRRAGAEGANADLWAPARRRHRVGHERGRGLVPRQDELEARGAEALDEIDDLAAGVTHDVAHAGLLQAVTDESRDVGHRLIVTIALMLVAGREVAVTNPDKVYFPKDGITKGDLVQYYVDVAAPCLNHVQRRPMQMKRHPNGVEGDFF